MSEIAALRAQLTVLEARLNASTSEFGSHVLVNNITQDTMWVILTAMFVLMMQLGFAMLEAGSVRSHNAIATYAKNILDFVHGALMAALISYWIAYHVHPLAAHADDVAGITNRKFFQYLAFQATTATIVSGAMAERVTLRAYLIICTLVSGFVFPFAVYLTWGGGWLSQLSTPFHDFAGSGVVHMIGGFAGATGAFAIGPRAGRWDSDLATDFRPHNVISVLSGVLLLWVGWYGFNPGSTGGMSSYENSLIASQAAVTTTVAAASGGAVTFTIASMRTSNGKVDILALANGILSGLVAITAGCDAVSGWASLLIGVVSAVVYLFATAALEQLRIDDVVGAFPVHGACGLWGLIAVGLFHAEHGLLIVRRVELLLSQLIGAAVLVALSVGPMGMLTFLMRRMHSLRISEEEEDLGMDSIFGYVSRCRPTLAPLTPHMRSVSLCFRVSVAISIAASLLTPSRHAVCSGGRLNAYENHSDFVARHHIISEMLAQAGCHQSQLVDALSSLNDNIFRPLSPNAGDHRLDGEIADILEHIEYVPRGSQRENASAGDAVASAVSRKPKRHLMFLSHYKATGGEAVRIFIDRARHLLLNTSFGAEKHRAAFHSHVSEHELIYLDSVNLKDLGRLLEEVDASINLVLFLTRNCLARPWVLAELCKAYMSNINIVLVRVETTPDKAFRFPTDVDKAVKEWSWFARAHPKRQLTKMANHLHGRAKTAMRRRILNPRGLRPKVGLDREYSSVVDKAVAALAETGTVVPLPVKRKLKEWILENEWSDESAAEHSHRKRGLTRVFFRPGQHAVAKNDSSQHGATNDSSQHGGTFNDGSRHVATKEPGFTVV